MTGEFEAAGLAIHAKDGDVVGSLIAAIEELAGGVEVEAARIIPPGPFLPDERQFALRADGKDPDAVVEPVARVDKPPIGGNQDLGAEVAAGEPGRQGGDRLPRGQPPRSRDRSRTGRWSSLPPGSSRTSGHWGENGNAEARLRAATRLRAVHSGSERPSDRRISRRRSDPVRGPRAARSGPRDRPGSCGAWVRSCPLKARLPGGALVALAGPILPASFLMSEGSPRRPSGQDRQHRHGAAEIVGHQQEMPGRMDAHISGTGAAGADGVEQRPDARPPDRWQRR